MNLAAEKKSEKRQLVSRSEKTKKIPADIQDEHEGELAYNNKMEQ